VLLGVLALKLFTSIVMRPSGSAAPVDNAALLGRPADDQSPKQMDCSAVDVKISTQRRDQERAQCGSRTIWCCCGTPRLWFDRVSPTLPAEVSTRELRDRLRKDGGGDVGLDCGLVEHCVPGVTLYGIRRRPIAPHNAFLR